MNPYPLPILLTLHVVLAEKICIFSKHPLGRLGEVLHLLSVPIYCAQVASTGIPTYKPARCRDSDFAYIGNNLLSWQASYKMKPSYLYKCKLQIIFCISWFYCDQYTLHDKYWDYPCVWLNLCSRREPLQQTSAFKNSCLLRLTFFSLNTHI